LRILGVQAAASDAWHVEADPKVAAQEIHRMNALKQLLILANLAFARDGSASSR
jgi:hypothetical protein